jgi:ribosomal protein S18 acetylase RimI-like enzyme
VDLPARVRTVHADHWHAQGRLRERFGGAVEELRDLQVMFSGVRLPEFNGGDVTGPAPDLDGARAFYARHGCDDWGVRVPAGTPWHHGHKLRTLRLLGLDPGAHRRVPPAVPGLTLRAAVPHDIDAVLAVDAIAFGIDPGERGPWFAPMLATDAATVAIGELDGEPVACGYIVYTAGRAGPAAHLGGVGVLPAVRGRGIAAALSHWLLEVGWARGAQLAELHADSDAAARVYHRLGFFEAGGLDVYVEL